MKQENISDHPKAIKRNYEIVLDKVQKAALHCGRNLEEIKVIVVSKEQPVDVIQHAIEAGIRIFGENYPEEAASKIVILQNPSLEWHMIGHLQSRKAKIVVDYFHSFDALDSLKLAAKLDRVLHERNKHLPVLLEFNVGGEESKSGWLASNREEWPQIADTVVRLMEFTYLDIRGLMTMPPLDNDPEKSRPYFGKLRELRDYLESHIPSLSLRELSMGTSFDFVQAVKEGATMVRIGQAILGQRPRYKNID
jgi:pyridoxal phosphate enzyme (YggS family)